MKTLRDKKDNEDLRMFAASQDLLDALKMANKVMKDYNIDEIMAGEFEIFTDAVAKAEG